METCAGRGPHPGSRMTARRPCDLPCGPAPTPAINAATAKAAHVGARSRPAAPRRVTNTAPPSIGRRPKHSDRGPRRTTPTRGRGSRPDGRCRSPSGLHPGGACGAARRPERGTHDSPTTAARVPFPRLHSSQAVRRLSSLVVPPAATDTTWSTWSTTPGASPERPQ